MDLTRFALVGALALGVAACHTPENRLCDSEVKAERVACVVLIVGAVKAVKLIAFSHSSEPSNDTITE
ncbi:MAG TPA: hypothetical protein VMW31_00540 [Devosiaceae bacterium]|nr:hypothetical protein [Devosiaceae bacterium]